jgi:hypothetical protein
MADGAEFFFHGVPPMGFLEIAGAAVMAGNAQFRRLGGEQVLLRGGVGGVALQAALVVDDRVDDFAAVFPFIVAGETDRIPLFRQEVRLIRGMRIVAGNAFPLAHSGMDVALIQLQVLDLVAGVAEVIALFLQNELCHHPMAKMALLALFLRHHLVDVLSGKILIGKIRVAVQTAFLGESSFLGRGVLTEGKDGQTAAKQRCSPNG